MRDVKTEGAVMYETLARGIKENNVLQHFSQLWREITRNSNKTSGSGPSLAPSGIWCLTESNTTGDALQLLLKTNV
jgi:hypothetical protein